MQNNFLLSAFIALAISGGSILYIITYINPGWVPAIVLFGAIAVLIDITYGLAYFFAKPIKGLGTPREHFRTGLKKGLWLSMVVILVLIAKTIW